MSTYQERLAEEKMIEDDNNLIAKRLWIIDMARGILNYTDEEVLQHKLYVTEKRWKT